MLNETDKALLSREIATKTGLKRPQVSVALNQLTRRSVTDTRKVYRKGWIHPSSGKEIQFQNGYLYYTRLEQYQRRAEEKDYLPQTRRTVYQHIKTDSERGQFTGHEQVCELLSYDPSSTARFMKETMALVPEIHRIEIGSHTYYYLTNRFSPDQVESKKIQYETRLNQEGSRRADKGRCFETFAKTALQLMVDRNHLRLPQDKFSWDYSYKDGEPNYSVKVQCLDGSKYHEFDRVLRVPMEPINRERFRQEIVFVLECKYRSKRTFTYKDIQRFAQNLANTYQFGYTARSRSLQGQWFHHRAIRHNVVPVLVTGGKGLDFDHYDEFTHTRRRMNPVGYAAWMGMILIFAGDLERYLAEQTGKPAKFSRIYDQYAKQDKNLSFEEHLQGELGLS